MSKGDAATVLALLRLLARQMRCCRRPCWCSEIYGGASVAVDGVWCHPTQRRAASRSLWAHPGECRHCPGAAAWQPLRPLLEVPTPSLQSRLVLQRGPDPASLPVRFAWLVGGMICHGHLLLQVRQVLAATGTLLVPLPPPRARMAPLPGLTGRSAPGSVRSPTTQSRCAGASRRQSFLRRQSSHRPA